MTPRKPAILTVAAALYVLIAMPGLVSNVLEFATPPDANAPTSPFVVPQSQNPAWVEWLAPILVILLALLLREGRNGIRVTLTIVSALLGLVAVSDLVDGQTPAVGVPLLVLILVAPVLLYWPTSNAYYRHIRQLRTART